MAEESYEGRCMRCKKQVPMNSVEVVVNARGMRMAKGKCECGTTVCRILGKA